jgi:hypothetical protein
VIVYFSILSSLTIFSVTETSLRQTFGYPEVQFSKKGEAIFKEKFRFLSVFFCLPFKKNSDVVQ